MTHGGVDKFTTVLGRTRAAADELVRSSDAKRELKANLSLHGLDQA